MSNDKHGICTNWSRRHSQGRCLSAEASVEHSAGMSCLNRTGHGSIRSHAGMFVESFILAVDAPHFWQYLRHTGRLLEPWQDCSITAQSERCVPSRRDLSAQSMCLLNRAMMAISIPPLLAALGVWCAVRASEAAHVVSWVQISLC